jgi:hypothetical protein
MFLFQLTDIHKVLVVCVAGFENLQNVVELDVVLVDFFARHAHFQRSWQILNLFPFEMVAHFVQEFVLLSLLLNHLQLLLQSLHVENSFF